jgi:hypothetical protein
MWTTENRSRYTPPLAGRNSQRNGEPVAGHAAHRAAVGRMILSSAWNGGYRSSSMFEWAGHLGSSGLLKSRFGMIRPGLLSAVRLAGGWPPGLCQDGGMMHIVHERHEGAETIKLPSEPMAVVSSTTR